MSTSALDAFLYSLCFLIIIPTFALIIAFSRAMWETYTERRNRWRDNDAKDAREAARLRLQTVTSTDTGTGTPGTK